jgi:uncharacterized protein with ParB-like and HNH nuclease domain
MSFNTSGDWAEDYAGSSDDLQIDEYELTATPNDFNVITLFNFIESGAVRIPGFQRNFVWDIGRASKLIESLILGLPVPQLFLYEQARNRFLVIDGQQRLMSIYYFIKMRFPKKEKRVALRMIFDAEGKIPNDTLFNDEYFQMFNLRLAEKIPNRPNKFKGLNYATLADYKTQFDLRPIRNVIVKQNVPNDDDSSIYEIFNRLNTGGINLRPQEIRTSMYHSNFYEMLYKINLIKGFRRLLKIQEPDLNMKDIEILLRGFAMLIDWEKYAPSMVKFLNLFSKNCQGYTETKNAYLYELFQSFLESCSKLDDEAFLNKKNRRFNIALYEAVFTVVCEPAYKNEQLVKIHIDSNKLRMLETDDEFQKAAIEGTTRTTNVHTRIRRAKEILGFF